MHSENIEAKERILRASIQLFSEKGFDATSVTEIAQSAGVTKALIYYYFKSKEEILDYLVQSLRDRTTSIKMDFVHANIVQMIHDGRLDIMPDRLSFTSEEDTSFFLENGYKYFREVLDFALENRTIIRILMSESLKSSKNCHELFYLMSLAAGSGEDPAFQTISRADSDFNYSADMVMFKFFYTTFPLVNFAVYYDDYKAVSGQSDEALRASFLQTFRIISSSMISGKDILLHT
ncbi:MAG TPA: helix-turn-helix domain-containing protein [Feifaniaceae bacterium]|nr:helix-turn-helix domain-containing protein [Feifaniaceae bacterium]